MRTLYLAPEVARRVGPDEARAFEVSPLLRELITYILGLTTLDEAIPHQHRVVDMLVDLIERAAPIDLTLPLPRDARALSAAHWLRAHPDDSRDLVEVARAAGTSVRTLQRLFRAETGMPLSTWRKKARLIHAVACLGAGQGVTEAAAGCGYESVSAFIASFRAEFGVTPGRY